MSYREILEHTNFEELLQTLADGKIDSLSYAGFAKLSKWFETRLTISELQLSVASGVIHELLEARNCIVHNGCRANAKYLRANGLAVNKQTIGQPIDISQKFAFLAYCATAECVSSLDDALASKFLLDREPFNPHELDIAMFHISYDLESEDGPPVPPDEAAGHEKSPDP
jgi:hypothetical protein